MHIKWHSNNYAILRDARHVLLDLDASLYFVRIKVLEAEH